MPRFATVAFVGILFFVPIVRADVVRVASSLSVAPYIIPENNAGIEINIVTEALTSAITRRCSKICCFPAWFRACNVVNLIGNWRSLFSKADVSGSFLQADDLNYGENLH